jgi:hypothetical protein
MKQGTLQILGTIWLVGSIIVPSSIRSTLMLVMSVVLLMASLFCKEEK